MFASRKVFKSNFWAASSGNITLPFACSIIVLFSVLGGAIDYYRQANARTDVQRAIDSAVLAGTRALAREDGNEAMAIATAQRYFKTNLSQWAMEVTSNITFKVNQQGTGLVALGNAEIPTTFLKVVNVATLPLFNSSGAEVGAEVLVQAPGGDLEVALMLDVTGSMCDDGEGPCTSGDKIDAMKSAAKQLVDTVVWEDQSVHTSRIALVPFSTRVRVGPDGGGAATMKTLTNLDATWTGWYDVCTDSSGSGDSESGGTWTCNAHTVQHLVNHKVMPCVTDRFYNAGSVFDFTDAAPGPGAWLNAHDGSRMVMGRDSSNTAATTERGMTPADPARHWNFDGGGFCADVGEGNEIEPLTNDATLLKSRIDGLEAYGATAGVLGTAFAWYTVSPNWNSVWPVASQPKPYALLTEMNAQGKPKLRKAAILMSDGVYNTYRGWKDQDKTSLSTSAIAMCDAMKAAGIEVFTVGFALDELSTANRAIATNTLRGCGTTVDHFYDSLDQQQLTAAFESIAAKVGSTTLRLTR